MEYALITGATSGIGKEFAKCLARKGYSLILIGRRQKELLEVKKQIIANNSVEVSLVIGDLKDPKIIEEILFQSHGKKIKYLINNAGFGSNFGFFEGELQESLDMVEVHINVLIKLCKEISVHMNDGYIINVSSLAAYLPTAYNQIYSASKSFIITFSESLNLRLKENRVKVKVLCPGFTHTDFHRNMSIVRNRNSSWKWMNAEKVVEICMKNLHKNRVIIVPGILNKIAYLSAKLLPKKIMYFVLNGQKEL